MTRIDLSTREWHELIKPVIAHASTDKDDPDLGVIRIEVSDMAMWAVATDRYTLAAERYANPPSGYRWLGEPPVHVRLAEAKAALAMFGYTKDEDPPLRVTIDTAPLPVRVAGQPATVYHLAVTVESADGTRVVLHDARDATRDPLAGWKKSIRTALLRPAGRALNGLELHPVLLARWATAARRGERLTMYTGPEPGNALLVLVEKHFAGIMIIPSYLDSDARRRDESPWLGELGAVLDTEYDPAGQPAGGTVTTVDIDPALLRQAADIGPAGLAGHLPGEDDGPPPWVKAEHAGTCAGCGDPIKPGDMIQAEQGDGGGWVCGECGTGDDEDGEPE